MGRNAGFLIISKGISENPCRLQKLGHLKGDMKEERKSKVAHPKEKEECLQRKLCPQRICFKKMTFQV